MIPLVFFIDVDNTLLDNDHIKKEIKQSLKRALGEKEAEYFWKHHEALRKEKNLVDFPNTIRAYCLAHHAGTCNGMLDEIFDAIDFKHALYQDSIRVLQHLKNLGTVVLFTEGDGMYQKMKIEKSGLSKRVDRIELHEHKLEHLEDVIKEFKEFTKIFIDDRAQSLKKIKGHDPHIFTIEVCQGHYATIDHKEHEALDMVIDSISELLNVTDQTFLKIPNV